MTTTIWGILAKEWRIRKQKIDRAKLEENLGENLAIVKKTIEKGNPVPSALDDIYADDEDDDEDW
ncbi:hypothetical protein [Peribacillus frigoritolerans]|uniref:hypothetical protein n=1 Tax=Peribacillus frigoritolerans TaxID=450367 RepID=UPI0032E37EAE